MAIQSLDKNQHKELMVRAIEFATKLQEQV